jgi:hypothetical protein
VWAGQWHAGAASNVAIQMLREGGGRLLDWRQIETEVVG